MKFIGVTWRNWFKSNLSFGYTSYKICTQSIAINRKKLESLRKKAIDSYVYSIDMPSYWIDWSGIRLWFTHKMSGYRKEYDSKIVSKIPIFVENLWKSSAKFSVQSYF